LFRWLVLDPIVLWAALGLPLVILPAVLILLPTTPELSIRIAGYLIALLGVLLVVKGIREKRKLFGRPAIVKRMTAWLRRLPPIVLPAKQASGNVTVSLGGTSISATGGVSAVLIIATPTVEERVRVLEENLRLIEGRMNSFREEARNSVEVLRSETTTERSVQHEAHVELSTRLEDLSVGGLDFEAAGVVWVIAGSALTTFPAELSTLVTKLF
jgi:hypothetical protein